MKESNKALSKSSLEYLAEAYSENKKLKLLIDILPWGSQINNSISEYLQNQQSRRVKHFFDTLNEADFNVTSDLIEDDNFIHKFYITLKVVINTHRNEKIELIANFFSNHDSETLIKSTDYYENYLNILDELTYQEITILHKLRAKEIEYYSKMKDYDPYNSLKDRTMLRADLFESFVHEIMVVYETTVNETIAIISRIQRTGCLNFAATNGYIGTLENKNKSASTTDLYLNLERLIFLESK